MYILVFILMMLYAKQSGIKDAFIYNKMGSDSLPTNEHKVFVWERIYVGLLTIGGAFLVIFNLLFLDLIPALYWSMGDIIMYIVSSTLGFSYIHNGYYGKTMGQMGHTNYDWKYTNLGKGSNKIEYPYHERLELYWAAIVLLILYTMTRLFWLL